MESLTHLVTESLARYGYETSLDHSRLQWSKWFLCESSFSVLLAPSKPGVFALGEEIIAPCEAAAAGGKRMLALLRIAEAEDLGMALGHLFLPGNPEREKLSAGHCFVRYAVIEDAGQRQFAHAALQQWIAASPETASGVTSEFSTHNFPSANSQEVKTEAERQEAETREEVTADPEIKNSAA
jgi:hypothetical protein